MERESNHGEMFEDLLMGGKTTRHSYKDIWKVRGWTDVSSASYALSHPINSARLLYERVDDLWGDSPSLFLAIVYCALCPKELRGLPNRPSSKTL
jgi:hypothetical protein